MVVLAKVMVPVLLVKLVAAPKVTASLYTWLPVVVTLPAFRAVLPVALVVRLAKAVVAPRVPDKVLMPVVLRVSAWPPAVLPSTVANLMAPLPLLVTVLALLKVVMRPAADKSMSAVAEMLPPNSVLPEPLTVKFFKGVVPPTTPVVMVPPLLVSVKLQRAAVE